MKRAWIYIFLACIAAGCSNGSSGPPLDASQEQQANQLDQIAKKSGGDWNKLSAADKTAMIQIGGSEQGAKMLLLGKSGKIGHQGGPPGGPPGAPPGGPPGK